MSYQPHYIAAFEEDSGLNTYYEPFLLPEKAFPRLEDAYVWRGRVRRRRGFNYLGRLRREIVPSAISNSAASVWTFNIYTELSITGEPNAEIQAGTFSATVGVIVFTDNGDGTLSSITPGNSGTISYATGSVSLTHTAGVGVATTITFFYYPGLPVMGLPVKAEDLINAENLIAFDTKYAYEFISGQFQELDPTTTWQGDDKDFFWTQTYWPMGPASQKYLWATNFNNSATFDPIRYFDGANWNDFTPAITAADTLYTCELIVPYKNRLLFFNTWEGTTVGTQALATNFPQRLRFSQIGNPIAVDAWRSDIVGKGGFIDCPTDQTIISVEFIKDVLIVKCERSSWKIIYTGNETFPFYFEKINTELGAESTFSLVPFDRGVFSVGNVGICTDDSVNVYRIDQKIPQIVFQVRNAENGPERVHGIRDFVNELVYWAFPNSQENHKFPNKVLVYNYINQSYAIFNDSFTCYGYFQNTTNKTWADYTDVTWATADFTWDSGTEQARFPDIVAGNQQGFVLLLNQKTTNDFSLAINDITPAAPPTGVQITSTNHNLEDGDFVYLSEIIGTGPNNPSSLNDNTYRVVVIDEDTFGLESYDALTDSFITVELNVGGTYLGAGRIAKINNINITSKVFAPFYESGSQARLGYMDFLLDKTDDGQLTCSVFIDEQPGLSVSNPSVTIDAGGNPSSGLLGTSVLLTKPENTTLLPFQVNQSKIWHRFFVQAFCQNFQIQLTMSDKQMAQEDVYDSEIILHALVLYLSKNARLTQ